VIGECAVEDGERGELEGDAEKADEVEAEESRERILGLVLSG
jgi:hypothetical protein